MLLMSALQSVGIENVLEKAVRWGGRGTACLSMRMEQSPASRCPAHSYFPLCRSQGIYSHFPPNQSIKNYQLVNNN